MGGMSRDLSQPPDAILARQATTDGETLPTNGERRDGIHTVGCVSREVICRQCTWMPSA